MQEDRQQLAVEVDAESLRQDVGQLGFGVDKTGDVDAAGDTIAELVRVPKDMLSLLESNRIGSQVKGGLAIQEKRRGEGHAKTDVLKEVANVNALTARKGRRISLSLGGGRRHRLLQPRPPDDDAAHV